MNSLTLDRSLLRRVIDHVQQPRPAGGRGHPDAVVSAEALAATEKWNPECTCDLKPGMLVRDLIELEEGCTRDHPARGICARLDAVRRRYGK